MWLERRVEEVINEAAIITTACLRQLCKTTHTYTQTPSALHSPFLQQLICKILILTNDRLHLRLSSDLTRKTKHYLKQSFSGEEEEHKG